MIYTAGNQVARALRLLGVLAEGENPSAEDMSNGLMAFSQMIDAWSIQRLAVYAVNDQTFTWPGGQQTITVGGGTAQVNLFPTPTNIGAGTYFVLDGTSYPLTIIEVEQYNNIAVKTAQSPVPNFLYANQYKDYYESDLNWSLSLYPVPSGDLTFHLLSMTPLTDESGGPLTESTSLYLPRGYLRAVAYNLAVEIAPEYGERPSAEVKMIASSSKRDIKRLNAPKGLLIIPTPLTGRGWYNINTDGYQ